MSNMAVIAMVITESMMKEMNTPAQIGEDVKSTQSMAELNLVAFPISGWTCERKIPLI